jgi:diamine N-acetyltransferase
MADPGIALREVTADTVRAICALEPHESQRGFVAPNAVSIAQAYFNHTAVFRAIHAGETPVGFIMWRPAEMPRCTVLWRFMIDRNHQGRGHGRRALQLWLGRLAEQGQERVVTSYVAGEGGPHRFYLSLGFTDAGDRLANGEWPLERLL